jgi:hypothetical protein
LDDVPTGVVPKLYEAELRLKFAPEFGDDPQPHNHTAASGRTKKKRFIVKLQVKKGRY